MRSCSYTERACGMANGAGAARASCCESLGTRASHRCCRAAARSRPGGAGDGLTEDVVAVRQILQDGDEPTVVVADRRGGIVTAEAPPASIQSAT